MWCENTLAKETRQQKQLGLGERSWTKLEKKEGKAIQGGLHQIGRLEPSANYAPY